MSFTALDVIHQFRLDVNDYGGNAGGNDGYVNLFTSPDSPATQTLTLMSGQAYTLSMTGTGSIAATGFGTATSSTSQTYTPTATGPVAFTVTGSPTTIRLERGSSVTSDAYMWEQMSKEQLIWGNDQALRFFNRSMEEFFRRRPVVDNTTNDDTDSIDLTEITLVASTRDYAYSPKIQTIEKVVLNSTGLELEKWTPDSLAEYAYNWRTLSGVPKIYVEGLNGPYSISFIPKPSAADTVYLNVRRLGLTTVTWATRTTALTEPDDVWQDAIICGMKMFAYMAQDADARQPELLQDARDQFAAMVGPSLTAEEVENRRQSANLRVRYQPAASFHRDHRRYTRNVPDRLF